jgi:predicted aminopeptidase
VARIRLLLIALTAGLALLADCYIAKQGYYVTKYSFSARPIAHALKDTSLDVKKRRFLDRTLAIRKFAFDSIGLTRNRNYSTLITIKKQYLVDVVAASAADRFAPYIWHFPFFGGFPYKGFFDRKDALREVACLRRRGYDVTMSPVDAFSTLGFFSDPVYSFMADFTPYELASLIIHEETHATVFLKNRIALNEEMAEFVGETGALWFLKSTCGDTSAAYREALLEKADDEVWERKLRDLYDTLAVVYGKNIPRDEKLAEKAAIIAAFKRELTDHYSTYFKSDRFTGIEKANINNAYLAVRMNYYGDKSLFEELYKRNNNDLAAVVAELKRLKKLKKGESPEELLKGY